jgi:hypothetical protein
MWSVIATRALLASLAVLQLAASGATAAVTFQLTFPTW